MRAQFFCSTCRKWKPVSKKHGHECNDCHNAQLLSALHASLPPSPSPEPSTPLSMFGRPSGCIDQLTTVERAATFVCNDCGAEYLDEHKCAPPAYNAAAAPASPIAAAAAPPVPLGGGHPSPSPQPPPLKKGKPGPKINPATDTYRKEQQRRRTAACRARKKQELAQAGLAAAPSTALRSALQSIVTQNVTLAEDESHPPSPEAAPTPTQIAVAAASCAASKLRRSRPSSLVPATTRAASKPPASLRKDAIREKRIRDAANYQKRLQEDQPRARIRVQHHREMRGNRCQLCGQVSTPRGGNLEWAHIHGYTRDEDSQRQMISSLIANARSDERIDAEMPFVLLLCSDCHTQYDRIGAFCDDSCSCKNLRRPVALANDDHAEQLTCCDKMKAALQ
jgi:hypothetical protein